MWVPLRASVTSQGTVWLTALLQICCAPLGNSWTRDQRENRRPCGGRGERYTWRGSDEDLRAQSSNLMPSINAFKALQSAL